MRTSEYMLGSEPDDLAFRNGDLFPLGAPFDAEDDPDGTGGEALPAPARRLYGLCHTVPVRPEDTATTIDPRALFLCPSRQIALVDGAPLSVQAARTNGKTKVPYDTDTAPKKRTDQRDDVRDD